MNRLYVVENHYTGTGARGPSLSLQGLSDWRIHSAACQPRVCFDRRLGAGLDGRGLSKDGRKLR